MALVSLPVARILAAIDVDVPALSFALPVNPVAIVVVSVWPVHLPKSILPLILPPAHIPGPVREPVIAMAFPVSMYKLSTILRPIVINHMADSVN